MAAAVQNGDRLEQIRARSGAEIVDRYQIMARFLSGVCYFLGWGDSAEGFERHASGDIRSLN